MRMQKNLMVSQGAVTAIKLHNGVAVPQRVITKFNEFAHEELAPNWLSTLPAVIGAVCAKWQIELAGTIPCGFIDS